MKTKVIFKDIISIKDIYCKEGKLIDNKDLMRGKLEGADRRKDIYKEKIKVKRGIKYIYPGCGLKTLDKRLNQGLKQKGKIKEEVSKTFISGTFDSNTLDFSILIYREARGEVRLYRSGRLKSIEEGFDLINKGKVFKLRKDGFKTKIKVGDLRKEGESLMIDKDIWLKLKREKSKKGGDLCPKGIGYFRVDYCVGTRVFLRYPYEEERLYNWNLMGVI